MFVKTKKTFSNLRVLRAEFRMIKYSAIKNVVKFRVYKNCPGYHMTWSLLLGFCWVFNFRGSGKFASFDESELVRFDDILNLLTWNIQFFRNWKSWNRTVLASLSRRKSSRINIWTCISQFAKPDKISQPSAAFNPGVNKSTHNTELPNFGSVSLKEFMFNWAEHRFVRRKWILSTKESYVHWN